MFRTMFCAHRTQARRDDMQRSLSALMLDCVTGGVIDMTSTLQVFPVKLLTVAEYARYVLVHR